jgi:hypothetical protein
MTKLPFSPVFGVAVLLAVAFVTGCTSTGTTGDSTPARNSRGGGWENFRAQLTIPEQAPTAVS